MVAAVHVKGGGAGRIVVVRLRSVRLVSHLAGEHLRAVVKYGQRGHSTACETGPVVCERREAGADDPLPVTVDFDSACIFVWDEKSDPLVRLQLVRVGSGEEVAGAEFVVRLFGTEHEATLRAGTGLWRMPVGQISVHVDSRMLPMSEIRRGLQLREACMPEDEPLVTTGSFLVSATSSKKPGLDRAPDASLADCLEVVWAASKAAGRPPGMRMRPLVNVASLFGIA